MRGSFCKGCENSSLLTYLLCCGIFLQSGLMAVSLAYTMQGWTRQGESRSAVGSPCSFVGAKVTFLPGKGVMKMLASRLPHMRPTLLTAAAASYLLFCSLPRGRHGNSEPTGPRRLLDFVEGVVESEQ